MTYQRTIEQCYSRAWKYASSQADGKAYSNTNNTGAIAALHKEFIPNWTSEQFSGFVEKLAGVTDAWAAETESKDRDACEHLWMRVLELEAKFWPTV